MKDDNYYIKCKFCKNLFHHRTYEKHIIDEHSSDKRMKKEFLEHLKKEYFKKPRTKHTKTSNYEEINFTWNEISFDRNELLINSERFNRSIQPYRYNGLHKGLNIIKEEYFKRIYSNKLFKFKIRGNIILSTSQGLQELKETIETIIYIDTLKNLNEKVRINLRHFDKFTNEEIISIFYKSIKKDLFIKYLASIQSLKLKIIPIFELINSKIEESFIFRMVGKNDNQIFIWENVNNFRGTHVFICSSSNTHNALLELETYINSIYKNKRSSLYKETNFFKTCKSINYLGAIKHDTLDDYKRKLSLYVN